MPYHLFIQTDEGALDYRGSSSSREEGLKGLQLAEQHRLTAMLVEEVGMTSRKINFQEADEIVRIADALKKEFLGNYLLEQGEGGNA